MKSIIKEEIARLLNTAAQLCSANAHPAHDYPSLIQQVIQLELAEEIAILRAMLDAENFEQQFKQRCQFRSADFSKSINFDELPTSMTNKLYWDITTLVFTPKTMGEMLLILMPHIKFFLAIVLPELDSPLDTEAFNSHFRNLLPILKKTKIIAYDQPPAIESLTHCIISGTTLFNANDISHFSLKMHTWFCDYLSAINFQLAQKLYNHNAKLQSLTTHMQIYTNIGITPRTAIEQLIRWLVLGGAKYTGSEVASPSARSALERFFVYFNALPEETRKELRALNSESSTLGRIIDVCIEYGHCVETTAHLLKQIIDRNPNNLILNSPPKMKPADLKKIEAQYGPKAPLDTLRNDNPVIHLPKLLTKRVLETLSLESDEDLVYLLINFPTEFYDTLWGHVLLTENKMSNLANLIALGYFSEEQRQALAQSISKHYQRFRFKQPLLVWAILTNDVLFVAAALSSVPDKIKQITATYEYYPLLHYIRTIPVMNLVLNEVPEVERLALYQTHNIQGSNLLQKNANNPELLMMLLKSFPDEHFLDAVYLPDKVGLSLIDHLTRRPEVLAVFLNALGAPQKLQLINNPRFNRHFISTIPDCFKLIMEVFPEPERYSLLTSTDKEGETMLHSAALVPESLAFALTLIPEPQQLAAIKKRTHSGKTVVHKAVAHPESLHMALAIIPSEERLQLVTAKNEKGSSILDEARDRSIATIIELLPEEQRFPLLSDNGILFFSFFQRALTIGSITNLELGIKLLSALPATQRAEALLLPDNQYGCVIKRLAQDDHTLKQIMSLLPLPRDNMIRILNYPSYFSWVISTGDPVLFREIFESYSEPERLEAIKKIDHLEPYVKAHQNHSTLLHRIIENSELLRVLIQFFPNYLQLHDDNNLGKGALDYFRGHPKSIAILLEPLSGTNRMEVIKRTDHRGDTILHKACFLNIPVGKILNLFPEHERLELMQIKNGRKNSLLASAVGDFKLAQELISLLPMEHRLEALLAERSDGICILSDILSNVTTQPQRLEALYLLLSVYKPQPQVGDEDTFKSMPYLLALLPEKYKISLLKMHIGNQSILHVLSSKGFKVLTTDQGFADSFVPDLLVIHKVLVQHANAKPGSMVFFKSSKAAHFLLKSFTIDEVSLFKENLIAHLIKNKDSYLSKELLHLLVPDTYAKENKIEHLKQRWEGKAAPSTVPAYR